MFKKQFFLIIGGLLAASLILVIFFFFFFRSPYTSKNVEQPNSVNPPVTSIAPQSLTPNQDIWTGVLTLVEPPTLKVDGKIYTLRILDRNSLSIFEGKGYKTGDTVNVMGILTGDVIDVSGLNKFVP
ncbi:MAG: hypothetical protein UT86_C0001G0208 [Candidatus Magasanikbacteria bacterium GW2011_GWC2_40_17]|uniref:Uncharacterized protein n=1 Tax=Candidatus Magasanikbacteria bacterium GW2011_GWA2_42_32 TaxID=1619039 RepID=A0A0G1D679_9BACT|nr:MAG: hypothetical protein UT86_C0001G0208 [Candidatus Magasanikbacteria bacterium GW2011_GWC2_40_17]KKS57568.1 MAG: hypothetical protein UV20_C0001G0208 [Candidatus Magasanikbacteria bacterium GW2011_GWA2_42_32]OGH85443.1 MAG: hypothetical protein A2294_03500 [Candidatus Magasanikbacteria bacterium RIFOXYB2_FULL_38_10]